MTTYTTLNLGKAKMNDHWFYIQRWAKSRLERESREKRLNKNKSQTSNKEEETKQ